MYVLVRKKGNARIIDTSTFLYKVSDQKGGGSYLFGMWYEAIIKFNMYNAIRDLVFEDKYENLMTQYKSLKGKTIYVLYNVFVINLLINSTS